MSMTREEAIKRLKELKARCERLSVSSNYTPQKWREDAEAVRMALSVLRPVSREQVEKVWRGEWVHPHWSNDVHCMDCKRCGKESYHLLFRGARDYYLFCPHCGAPMTDEAVEMVMERMEALYERNDD